MIRVIATIETLPGKRDELVELFRQLAPKVRAEEGCLEYAPMIDLPTTVAAQPPAREDAVTVVEQWASIEALEAHLMAPHTIEFRRLSGPLRRGVTLHVLRPA